jgi:hypothetical protein
MPESGTIQREAPQAKGPVMTWFEDNIKSATIKVDEHLIGDLKDWKFSIKDGITDKLMNADDKGNPKYFYVGGRKISNSGREVDAFFQPGIIEVPDPNDPDKAVATVGLLVDDKTGDILIQTSAEPFQAEPGSKPELYAVLRSTVQGSYTNVKEHKVTFSDKVNLDNYKQLIPINPSRIQGKARVGFTIVNKEGLDLKDNPSYRWFSRAEIDEGIRNGAPFNGFFHVAYSNLKAHDVEAKRIANS